MFNFFLRHEKTITNWLLWLAFIVFVISFVSFVHREFEIISLIVLRDVFKQLDNLSVHVTNELLLDLVVISVGSLILYFLVEVLERIKQQIVTGNLLLDTFEYLNQE